MEVPMKHGMFWRLSVVGVAIATAAAVGATSASAGPTQTTANTVTKAATAANTATKAAATAAARTKESYWKPSCAYALGPMCTEVSDYHSAFGAKTYVGHDEPSALFYSNTPGSGNRNQWEVTLPKDPAPAVVPGRSWSFQLTPAFWFGMALCDTQSYPQQVSTCTPNSDANATSDLTKHPGTAFMELQFYPPGWVKQFNSQSCDARDWCAALNIDSLSEDPVNGTVLNSACRNSILGGTEYVNFAFLTKSGKPIGPPNPLQFDPATAGNPTRAAGVLFMHQGDRIKVTMHDTAHGLITILNDLTTGQSGFMTASAANGFGQIKAAPTGTSCTQIPYDFHPIYSTSSPATRVPWAAHSYSIAQDVETGHFDYCTTVDNKTGNCTGQEGAPGDLEPADGDDAACFPAAASLLVQVSGCNGTNDPGFDGTPYQRAWPDGNTRLHPTAAIFTSPRTGSGYDINYGKAALETDLPRIEAPDLGGVCNRATGVGCTLIPPTDDGTSANFYPFYSITSSHRAGGCQWFLGDNVPGLTANNFGGIFQYGTLLQLVYLKFGGHGATQLTINNYQQAFNKNPCPAR
jgi:hypothetical protein